MTWTTTQSIKRFLWQPKHISLGVRVAGGRLGDGRLVGREFGVAESILDVVLLESVGFLMAIDVRRRSDEYCSTGA